MKEQAPLRLRDLPLLVFLGASFGCAGVLVFEVLCQLIPVCSTVVRAATTLVIVAVAVGNQLTLRAWWLHRRRAVVLGLVTTYFLGGIGLVLLVSR